MINTSRNSLMDSVRNQTVYEGRQKDIIEHQRIIHEEELKHFKAALESVVPDAPLNKKLLDQLQCVIKSLESLKSKDGLSAARNLADSGEGKDPIDSLIHRAALEPYQAKTDGIIVKPLQTFIDAGLAETLRPIFRESGLLQMGQFKAPPQVTGRKIPNLRDDPAGLTDLSWAQPEKPEDALSIRQKETAANALLPLPLLLMEYKKRGDTATKATNQTRLYLISSVRFLATLGLFEVPVFATLTSGAKAGVFLAWAAEHNVRDTLHIITQRRTRVIDIATLE